MRRARLRSTVDIACKANGFVQGNLALQEGYHPV